jgi:chromosome segregation ATPase
MVLRKQRQLEQTQKAKQSKSSKHRSLNHRRRTPNAENSMPMGNHATIRPRSAQLARSSAPTPGMTMAQIVRQDRDRAAAVAEKENRRVGAEEEPWAYPEASFETDAERELFRLKVDNLVQKEVTRKRDTVEFERTAKEQAEQKHVMHFVKELSLKVMHNEHKVAATKTLLEHRADRLGALEDALEDAHADTETLRVALRERETHAAKLTIDLELEQDTTGRFERQTAKLTSQIEVLTLKDRNQTDKLATLAEEHNALRDNHAQLQSNALTYSTRNEKLDSELLAARNTLATHDATIAQLTAQVKTLVQKLAAVEKANADLTDRLNHGKSKLSELQYIQTTYDYIKGQYDVQYAELEQIKRVMAAQENEIETRLGALREQEEVNVRSSASVQLRKCQIQLKAAQAQAEQLRTDIVQHDISFQAKHRTLIEKATKYDLFYDKYVKCAARQPRLERELKTAKSQLVSTRKALEKTKDQLEDQKTVTQRFRTRSLKIESLHTVAKNHSTVLERRVSELLVTIERMKMDSKSRGGQQSALTDSLNTQLHEISHKYLATQTEISRLQENSRVVTREKVGLEALVQQYREGQLQDMQLVEVRSGVYYIYIYICVCVCATLHPSVFLLTCNYMVGAE